MFMPKKTPQKSEIEEKIALLMKRAESRTDLKKAKKDVRKARALAMKYRISMNRYRKKICKDCKAFLVPGRNCRIRIHKTRVIYKCLECNNFMRFCIKK